jgi:hypothetical protein
MRSQSGSAHREADLVAEVVHQVVRVTRDDLERVRRLEHVEVVGDEDLRDTVAGV